MGASVGAAAVERGARVLWASQGRSDATKRRAEKAGCEDLGSVEALVEESEIVLSICPPTAAQEVADLVARFGFDGIFVDANAVAPPTTERVETAIRRAGARFVDGGIIGPPAWRCGTTRLFLCGEQAAEVAAVFEGSSLEPICISGGSSAASALKMCYAAYTKGNAALLIAIRALARKAGVENALLEEWSRSQPDLAQRSEVSAERTVRKAWRFAGEMREIATTFSTHELPDGFHLATGNIYQRLRSFKDHAPRDTDEIFDCVSGTRASGNRVSGGDVE